jgi:hypothetical protein
MGFRMFLQFVQLALQLNDGPFKIKLMFHPANNLSSETRAGNGKLERQFLPVY